MTPLDAIAVAMLASVTPQSRCMEYAGVIIEDSAGSLRATVPEASGHADTFAMTVRLAVGEQIAALYHTHPACRQDSPLDTALFSPQDLLQADRLGVPSYIAVMADHSIRVYIPGKSRAFYYTPPGGRAIGKVSEGTKVTSP